MPQLSAVGIDLGTTYSSLAIVNPNGTSEIVPNSQDHRLTPSVVFFDQDAPLVGQFAKDHLATDPDKVVMFIKRQMGTPSSWHYTYKGARLSPTDVSALILQKLKEDAEQRLNYPLPCAVITVPAYFDDVGRRTTTAAGEMAGFRVLDLINEPTAAAIAFGADSGNRAETVLIYDLGGGTFDVTIMRIEGQKFTVLSTDGDHQLGGKDFDDAIMRYVVEQFTAERGFDPTTDAYVAAELRERAQRAKEELSSRAKTSLLLTTSSGRSQTELSREQFEALIKPKLDTSLTIVRSALAAAKLKPDDLDRVLLIGGSTRIPAVKGLLRGFFRREPDTSVNPEEAVALGAAIVAARKVADLDPSQLAPAVLEKVSGLEITDVTSHSIGIEASVPGTTRKLNAILIKRNSPIPAEVSKEFLTTLPDQRAIKVTVYQGEFQDPALCNPIGEFTLGGLPAGRPAGRKVRVTIACETNGVVSLTALDIESGKQTTTEVSYRDGESGERRLASSKWDAGTPVV